MDGNFYSETYTYREGRILIYKRPNSKNFQCRLRVKGIKGYTIKSCDTSNLGEAVQFAEDLYDNLRFKKLNNLPLKTKTFKQIFDEWFQKADKSEDRQEFYQGRAKLYWFPYFGNYKIEEITESIIDDYWPWRKNYYKDNPEKLKGNVKEDPAAQSLKMEKTAIQEVLDYAHRRGYIRAVPKINFKPRAKTENRATFTKKEYERLIMEMFMWTVPDAKASDSYQRNMIYNLIVFLANTGIRPSEYYKIKWKDIIVHSQNGIKLLYINVPENTKTGQRIVVSLPEAYTCYDSIKSFSKYIKENDYVFTNYDGSSMKNWTKTYKKKLEELNLYLDDEGNPRPPYSLRHYYATQRLLDGVSVYDLAKNMGTSVKQIENHYGHVLAIQKTNELIQGADISSLQNYQESEEYQIYLSEKEKNEQLLAKGKAQLAKLEKEHIQLIKETDELFKQSEAEIVRLEQEFEENLKEMDEKALQKSKKKLMKLCHKNKHHPELYANYTKQISRIDFYLEKFNQI